MTRHRIAQITENRNPKSPETWNQTRRFRQNRSLQTGRSPALLNGLAVLHGRLYSEGQRSHCVTQGIGLFGLNAIWIQSVKVQYVRHRYARRSFSFPVVMKIVAAGRSVEIPEPMASSCGIDRSQCPLNSQSPLGTEASRVRIKDLSAFG
jgi:hypothetical protein